MDLHTVAERSLATEQDVPNLQELVTSLQAELCWKLRLRSQKGVPVAAVFHFGDFLKVVEGWALELFFESWIQAAIPSAWLSPVFVMEKA
ncbi:hypothetical protein NDU88_006804, partial [Pleurodeles waltl]